MHKGDVEELDFCVTPLGELILRRRYDQHHEKDAYEVKLNDEFLMSSLFTVGEVALGRIALGLSDKRSLRVVVGGLGLGYTAVTVLEDPRVVELEVIEYLKPVIDWHHQKLVPLGKILSSDSRCSLIQGDFFEWPYKNNDTVDIVLLDIDHSPQHLLNSDNYSFYWSEGLRLLCGRLESGGIFSMWSNDLPDRDFELQLQSIFDTVKVEVVEFLNPYTNGLASCSIYTGITPKFSTCH